jgi:hypothetical protein
VEYIEIEEERQEPQNRNATLFKVKFKIECVINKFVNTKVFLSGGVIRVHVLHASFAIRCPDTRK